MKRLRALHIVHDSPRISQGCGGTERYVDALASTTGDPVLTRRRDGSGDLERQNGDYPLWVLSQALPAAPRFRDTWTLPAMEAALGQVLEKEKVDVVHIHHFAHLGFGLAETASKQGVPVLFHLHDYHSICVRGQLVQRDLSRCDGPSESKCAACVLEHLRAGPALHMAARFAKALGVRKVARDWIAKDATKPKDLEQVRDRIEASKSDFAHISRFLSPSHNLANRMKKIAWADPNRIFVEDLPLNKGFRSKATEFSGPLRFLFVGSLIPTKGPHLLLEAVKGLECEVFFYGPTPGFDGHPGWGEALVSEINSQPSAHYGGVFQTEDRDQVYENADVLVLPSTWEENSPLVLREGLAAGLPVIASLVGGLKELAPKAQFVPPDSVTALRKALQTEIQTGRRRNPRQDWPMSAHIEALQRHYSAVLSSKSAARPIF
jgi:glycosyltransferase involved in cell wall biosynthesis